MIIIKDLNDAPHLLRQGRAAVTIGNFDGCHLGHQSLIYATLAQAHRLQAAPVAITFEPRAEAFFKKLEQEPLLFTCEQKSRALSELGIAAQVVQRFDQAFSIITHEDFYENYLIGFLKAAAIIIGDNFRFGHNRQGDAAFLQRRAASSGVEVTLGPSAVFADERISSTRLRRLLAEKGAVEDAAAMLGRPYLLEGVIRQGDQLGRQLGVPTANLEEVQQIRPLPGVYAGFVWLEGLSPLKEPTIMQVPKAAVPAVFSLGIRPTLTMEKPPFRIEAHLLKGAYGENGLYNQKAGYYLTHRLRGEERFANLDDLKQQMQEDIRQAKALVSSMT